MSALRSSLALLIGLGSIGLVSHACVIADPPTDLQQFPEMRPTILRSSVVPSASAVLGRWPTGGKFIVPVELFDPRVTFQFSAFVDYNPVTGDGIDGRVRTSEFEPQSSSTRGRVRTLEVQITPPSSDRCHVVEVIVALRFISTSDSKSSHTPAEPGGDSVTWFYSPSGDLAGCPIVDAGVQPLEDGGSDAEAGLQ